MYKMSATKSDSQPGEWVKNSNGEWVWSVYKSIRRLQNSLLTSWLWKYWSHEETGEICILPLWKNPGKQWYKCNYKT